MKISYKWLNDYLPDAHSRGLPGERTAGMKIEPDRLSRILTSIGLEVEDYYKYEEVKGSLAGLVIGEILACEKHPNADKLTITRVNVGSSDALTIVCGAPNVAIGQKVIVAQPGVTIYPIGGEPVVMKKAKIRGTESEGMICAEDEIGLGSSHAGIIVLDSDAEPGTPAANYFNLYDDWVYEIGLTANRMDAMSHWGVARDVCAWLSHHDKKMLRPSFPLANGFKVDNNSLAFHITIENKKACQRYSGISIANIGSGKSPLWMQQRLKAIGVRPINNIVDITNYIQHETGQPLHAFDADELHGGKIIIKNLPEGTEFITLDEKKRKLSSNDLMICDADGPVCIAGVFGGLHSGVTEKTRNIFLESAWFNPVDIRRTSFRHNLRTDAASRFEKGIDISNTVNVLKRAAALIKEICGGQIASPVADMYPEPKQKTTVSLKYHYLKKLSGKNYHPDSVRDILLNLGFEMVKDSIDEIVVAAPFYKPDISLPADVVEEIVRIDGLDNIEIPAAITMTPSIEENYAAEALREKVAQYFVGLGFNEIMTNSITNRIYFDESELVESVNMLNSLSAELNIMRPSMLETGLESIAYNLNRKNNNLKFFDFGKTYTTRGAGEYIETEHLCLYLTGETSGEGWRNKPRPADVYFLNGIVSAVLKLLGTECGSPEEFIHKKLSPAMQVRVNGTVVVQLGAVSQPVLERFNIKQPVFFADVNWKALADHAAGKEIKIEDSPRFPSVHRDLAIVVSSGTKYLEVEETVQKLRLEHLQEINLFDVYAGEKLGKGKKSLAMSFLFVDKTRTLTDKEIDSMMTSIMAALEKNLNAEIRK